jgi:TetR/AcrR family transcriptional regulator, repressor of fatR-cypB operon
LSKSIGAIVARPKDDEKRQAIRDAVIAVVIEGGLANVSISKIAKRAGVSSGTIYLYFSNKEELIQQTYLDIKTDWFDAMFDAANSGENSTDKIRNMWFALFDFVVARPNEFLFSETVGAAHLIDVANEASISKKIRKLEGVMTNAIKDGTLAKAPVASIQAVLMAPAVQLAKTAARDKKKVKPALLRDTFDIVWRGLSSSKEMS